MDIFLLPGSKKAIVTYMVSRYIKLFAPTTKQTKKKPTRNTIYSIIIHEYSIIYDQMQ